MSGPREDQDHFPKCLPLCIYSLRRSRRRTSTAPGECLQKILLDHDKEFQSPSWHHRNAFIVQNPEYKQKQATAEFSRKKHARRSRSFGGVIRPSAHETKMAARIKRKPVPRISLLQDNLNQTEEDPAHSKALLVASHSAPEAAAWSKAIEVRMAWYD